jgi:hypothetical protein
MVYVTLGMRRKMKADADEARHPKRAAERVAYRKAAEQALAETMAQFPTLTVENFEAANAYREKRMAELMEKSNVE